MLFVGHPNEKSLHDDDNGVGVTIVPYSNENLSISEWIARECEHQKLLIPGLTLEWADNMNTLYGFVCKVLLYINSASCDVTIAASKKRALREKIDRLRDGDKGQKKKAYRLEAEFDALPKDQWFNRRVLGSNLVIQRPLPPPSESGNSGVKWDHQVLVRGHFRNQPYGPKSGLRKIIFIAPHYAGPEAADVVLRKLYRVR